MDNLTKQYIGVDVSKKTLDIYLLPLNKALKIKNDKTDIDLFIQTLEENIIEQIVCEATGGYEKLLVSLFRKANYKVWVVEPKRVKAFIVSDGIKHKTDAIDAKMIARFASQKKQEYVPIELSKDVAVIKSLYDRKNDLIKMMASEKTRLEGPSHELEPVKLDIQEHIIDLKKRIEKFDKQILSLIKQNKDMNNRYNIAISIPGIGNETAQALLSHIPELGHLDIKPISAIAGLVPYAKQSGQYKGKSMIQAGREMPRKILFMAALSACTHNSKLKSFYLRLKSKGKASKVALVAVMRKLITILNVMLRKNEVWNANY